jgi:hypothetical protein
MGMYADEPPGQDPFAPPPEPIEVGCLHCGQVYRSDQIVWRPDHDHPELGGHWCCPTPGCDGVGFGFDILPTDETHRDEFGEWITCDDEESDEDEADAIFSDPPALEALPSLPEPASRELEDLQPDDRKRRRLTQLGFIDPTQVNEDDIPF